MNYNHPNTKLDELIYVAEKIIPPNLCDAVIEDIEKRPWKPHTWYNVQSNSYHSEETRELDVQAVTPELNQALGNFIIEAGRMYNENYSYYPPDFSKMGQIMNQFCPIRFNRYQSDQIMRQHIDHIHSIFDGKVKGIPVLSFILNFNDTYEGAKLFFWDDYAIDFGVGDICMWPSPFLWPHGVTEAINGTRYSAVTWGW